MATGRRAGQRRKRRRPLAKQISQGYRFLSMVNTISHVLHGDIGGLLKHLMRRKAHKKLGGWMR